MGKTIARYEAFACVTIESSDPAAGQNKQKSKDFSVGLREGDIADIFV